MLIPTKLSISFFYSMMKNNAQVITLFSAYLNLYRKKLGALVTVSNSFPLSAGTIAAINP